MNKITCTFGGKTCIIPNRWEDLTPAAFNYLFSLLMRMAAGKLSPGMVRLLFVCRKIGVDYEKITDPDEAERIKTLACQLTFPLSIVYPDNNTVLSGLPPPLRQAAHKIPPERLPVSAMTRYLQRLDYRFVIDDCYCAQLIPAVTIAGKQFRAYAINTGFGNLTCDLTALQYIEARQLTGRPRDTLPLLASILYHPGPYDSISAHRMAATFTALPEETLLAIAFNFQAFTNYLFTRTQFSILTKGKDGKHSPIATGALESLYSLSADGLGDMNTVCRMNIIQYLTILRKKTIECVKTLAAADKKRSEIEKITGLPISIIKQIL